MLTKTFAHMETGRGMEKKMKIAHVLTRFDPKNNPGGVERVVEEIAKRQAKNHEVEIICRNEYKNPEKEAYKNLVLKRANVANVSGLRTFSSFPSMRRLIRDSEAEIFHIHDWSPYLNYFLAGQPGKSVLTLHNIEEEIPQKYLQKFSVKQADKCVVVSQDIGSSLDSDVSVIGHGVDTKRFYQRQTKDYYIYIGDLKNSKGIKELCKVWNDDYGKLKVIGEGTIRKKLEKKYPDIGFLGSMSHEEVSNLLGHSKGILLPSRTEGFGLVWAEALMCGKPVLCTETGLGPEIPENYKAMIPREYSLEELEEAVKEIEEKDFESEEIREYAVKNFNWEKVSDQYIEVYKNL